MHITALETIRVAEFEELTLLRVHTSDGITGLGETIFAPATVEEYLHEAVAPRLIGKNPLAIERHAFDLPGYYIGHGGTGVSTRAHSAVDLALWDIFGKAAGQPLYQLLGGAYRDSIRIYNTCAGYRYGQAERIHRSGVAQRAASGDSGLLSTASRGPYEDLQAAREKAGALARDLLDSGITAMKIWPFDDAARITEGRAISAGDLRDCLRPLEDIRATVGDEMDVLIELHGLWQPGPAAQICRALEEFSPFWVEDPMKITDLEALSRLTGSTPLRFAMGETVGNRWDLKRLLDSRAADYIMFDLGWCGGVSEARRLITLADSYALPISPHDCCGPVVQTAGIHLAINAPNALMQETVRAFYTDWYLELVSGLPAFTDGYATPSTAPGLGLELVPGLDKRADATVRITTAD